MKHASLFVLLAACLSAQSTRNQDWPIYLGDKATSHYSTLTQITRENVTRLKVAWTHDTGDAGEFQANPLIINGVLYTASPNRKVMALDAATGKRLWTWDPASERPGNVGKRQRGVTWWSDGTERRLFTGAGPYLYALNPDNGQLIRGFGKNGSIHLGEGTDNYGKEGPPTVSINTPGVIYKDLYIVGGLTSGPGTIRAYDVRTGERKWIFYTIPRPGEYGYHSWPPEAYKNAGGASNWSGLSLDEKRGIVYVPTETAEPDFWGGGRLGANLFANCLLALDANTGKRLWHFQTVHHDLQDKDLPTPPVLLTVKHKGLTIDAVAQGTKNGLLFVFDRVTGEPLWPIHEVPQPASELPGDEAWPTQPIPVKPPPLTRQIYTENDISDISPKAKAYTATRYKQSGSKGAFPAPSLKETIIFPGYDGGMEWGGAAADPDGIYYANVNEIPWLYQMVSAKDPSGRPVTRGERGYKIQCGYCHGLERKGDAKAGFPALTDLARRSTREAVTRIVTQGGGRMPAFSHLSAVDRAAIIDFLLGEEQHTAPGAPRNRDDAAPYLFRGFTRYNDPDGYPAIKPPWGTLNAVDLNTGEIKWKVPLGEYPELTAKGIPPTGTENYGGPVVTASGLLFIGATADETFRAFDKNTGKILWSAKLPFSGTATPSTYMVNGKQYVVIAAGGGKSGRPAGGSIVAFALPD